MYELPVSQPVTVEYNPKLPPDAFDVIVVDECHRSIYGVLRQALEYFDAHLIGLTASPFRVRDSCLTYTGPRGWRPAQIPLGERP